MSAALPTRQVEKPWGRDVLPAPFQDVGGTRVGEIWFEPPAALHQLLVKYIFTSENLSVQVHPSDAQTRAKGLGAEGKEECWMVISAEPGAKLAIGFEQAIDAASIRAAALDGRIEQLLTWHPVQPGDFFYIPANTVHAIGAGIGLIEVQQNSDITYRLYDYGRPRELHLDDGVAVSRGERYPAALHRHLSPDGSAKLVDGPYFRLDRVAGEPAADLLSVYGDAPVLVLPLTGQVQIAGEAVLAGQCGLASSLDQIGFDADGLCLVTQPIAGARS